ncbi:ribonuclease H-like domain-containing protein [Dipodascopsis uninucleata]
MDEIEVEKLNLTTDLSESPESILWRYINSQIKPDFSDLIDNKYDRQLILPNDDSTSSVPPLRYPEQLSKKTPLFSYLGENGRLQLSGKTNTYMLEYCSIDPYLGSPPCKLAISKNAENDRTLWRLLARWQRKLSSEAFIIHGPLPKEELEETRNKSSAFTLDRSILDNCKMLFNKNLGPEVYSRLNPLDFTLDPTTQRPEAILNIIDGLRRYIINRKSSTIGEPFRIRDWKTATGKQAQVIYVPPDEGELYAHDLLRKITYPVVGFDMEWGIRFSIASVQIATDSFIYVFRIKKNELPKNLIAILESDLIVKVGSHVAMDMRVLADKFCRPTGFMELSELEIAIDPYLLATKRKNRRHWQTGLQSLCRDYLGFELNKGQQRSNWDRATLSQAQIEYAATDAYVSYKIAEELLLILWDDFQNAMESNDRPVQLPALLRLFMLPTKSKEREIALIRATINQTFLDLLHESRDLYMNENIFGDRKIFMS